MFRLLILSLGLLSFAAHAHFPLLHCKLENKLETTSKEKKQLLCIAGYSDGSLPGEVTLRVFNYEFILKHLAQPNFSAR